MKYFLTSLAFITDYNERNMKRTCYKNWIVVTWKRKKMKLFFYLMKPQPNSPGNIVRTASSGPRDVESRD